MKERKLAIVTGSSRGIGRSIAENLAREGYNLVINYRKNEKEAQKVARLCQELGAESLVVGADLTRLSEVEEMVAKSLEKFKRIDLLVNNAGITRDKLILRMDDQDFMEVIENNLLSAFNCSKSVSRPMLKARRGSIINISSIVGLRGNIGQSNYAASKAGIIGLTKSLAREFSSRNIRVNAIAPGFIDTDMTRSLAQEEVEKLREEIPLKRLGRPEDIAALVGFLAGDGAGYITGQIISVDGGMNI